MATMLKRDLVEEVAKSAKITKKEAADAIDAVFESITNCLLYTSPSPRDS